MSFFFILFTFYGLPIHIMRDLFVTARSFLKRLTAYLKYRQATQDMNARYEDATVEDLQREDTCIICREEMRPWAPAAPPVGAAAPRPSNERSRPKKLPCGHILHLGCLRSWLERQQVCPTCRRTVVETARPPRPNRNANPANGGAPADAPAQQGMRMINLGPLRLGFGQAPLRDFQQAFRDNAAADVAGNPRVFGVEFGLGRAAAAPAAAAAAAGAARQAPTPTTGPAAATGASSDLGQQLAQLEQRITQEIGLLEAHQQELQLVRRLEEELRRLRTPPSPPADASGSPVHAAHAAGVHRLTVRPGTAAVPAGSAEMPAGISIPEGWTLLPLTRADENLFATATATGMPVDSTHAMPTESLEHEEDHERGGPSGRAVTVEDVRDEAA